MLPVVPRLKGEGSAPFCGVFGPSDNPYKYAGPPGKMPGIYPVYWLGTADRGAVSSSPPLEVGKGGTGRRTH